jgi:hypothetical protein
MKPLSKLRFDSLAGYSRTPWLPLLVEEIGWFEEIYGASCAARQNLNLVARNFDEVDPFPTPVAKRLLLDSFVSLP